MFMLNNTDTLEAWSDTDAKVDYSIHGLVGTTFTNLATGTLNATPNTIVYTAGAAISVVSATFVNTDSSAVTVNFKLDPTNAGNDKFLLPVAVSLEAGYGLVFDGQRFLVMNTSGMIVQSVAVSDAAYAVGWNGETSVAASKNAIYDQMELRAPKATPTFTGVVTAPTIDLTGGQIAFPATAVPSGDPNTIDDYEEGTWTPTVEFGGNSVNLTYSAANTGGQYTKIGDTILADCRILLTNKGSSNGDAKINGLPFTSRAGNTLQHPAASLLKDVSFADQFFIVLEAGVKTLYLGEVTAAGGTLTTITDAEFEHTSQMWISLSYKI